MMKNNDHIEVMAKLGESHEVTADVSRDLEKYVCALYGLPKLSRVDDTRYALLKQRYAPNEESRATRQDQGNQSQQHASVLNCSTEQDK